MELRLGLRRDRVHRVRRRSPDMVRKRLEVLHDRGEVELISCTIRSKRWWVFRWANRISTLLRSSRDLANSGLPINARATSRASSCTSRGIFRKVIFGVHLALMWHEPQSRVLAR